MSNAQTRRQAYEAEKTALDACNAPPSAYARLEEAYFGATHGTGGFASWMHRNLVIILPALAAGAGLIGFMIFQGPLESYHAMTGWIMGKTELQKAQGEAITITATAPYAAPRAAAETETLQATARYAEEKAQADAEAAASNAQIAKLQVCKTQAETAEASGINKYDIPSFLSPECRTLLRINLDSQSLSPAGNDEDTSQTVTDAEKAEAESNIIIECKDIHAEASFNVDDTDAFPKGSVMYNNEKYKTKEMSIVDNICKNASQELDNAQTVALWNKILGAVQTARSHIAAWSPTH